MTHPNITVVIFLEYPEGFIKTGNFPYKMPGTVLPFKKYQSAVCSTYQVPGISFKNDIFPPAGDIIDQACFFPSIMNVP